MAPANEPGLEALLARALALRRRAAEPAEPAPVVGLGGPGRREAAAAGAGLLAEGRVAALVVAGGQGTRLGHAGPKGTYPLGPVTGRTLFGLQAERLRGLERRTGRRVPWIVMTSDDTDAATRDYFERAGSFGLEVRFVRQRSSPCVDFSARPLFAANGAPIRSPDGHGGMLAALAASGLLDELRERGFRALAYQQVDNPLARSTDPALLGWLVTEQAEVASKVVRKRHPGERLGTTVLREGRAAVVEYTELDPEKAEARDPAGELRLWAGAIGIHAFSLDFLARCAPEADALLPFHASAKPIAHRGADGRVVAPREPNGYKLERFIFDLLPVARRAVLVEALREDEYAPVKNAQGNESPATARLALDACARRWLEAAGWVLPEPPCRIELDHAQIDGPEDAAGLRARDVAADSGVRIGTGGSA